MFSIAAINDTDSKSKWEPLAPTKEAQEFHLSQTYHDGLLKLQAKEYEKSRELLESVLKDPLIANAQVNSSASDGHLLQLRFLALKNLAVVFLKQGSTYYENALRCYLQAVEIDSKDSVVWNQLGTLSCSMGSLSISRWAFEQGLLCSPNNWNCMEKLLEVLIAIGDEVACLSVAELILRHWPSHARALHVKSTIEESEILPFAPRGIDKLEPKHVRLKFPDKRKTSNDNADEDVAFKKLKQNKELHLTEVSWVALADALLEILSPQSEMDPEKVLTSPDIKLSIILPHSSEAVLNTVEIKGSNGDNSVFGDGSIEQSSAFKEKEANTQEEQPHERRSSRLERLRSRKPGKEESDSSYGKDPSKVVIQYLEPFIAGGLEGQYTINRETTTLPCLGNSEYYNVSAFVRETSNNYGAYHMGHLLLEEVARQGLTYQDAFVKFLELEKLTRHWGKERTAECNIFLAELYYDFGSCSPIGSNQSEFISETSYHLCKIIESVALDYPFHLTNTLNGGCYLIDSIQETSVKTIDTSTTSNLNLDSSFLMKKSSLWARFFWLSGRLSIVDGNMAKACEEFCIALSLLGKRENVEDSFCSVSRPHCKAVKELNFDRVLDEINILKVNFLMENSVIKMMEHEKYLECVSLLSPLLFSMRDVYPDSFPLSMADKKDEKITSTELMAVDVLMEACQKTKPMDVEMYFNCHYRKLKILMTKMGLSTCIKSFKSSDQAPHLNASPNFDIDSKESPSKHCSQWVVDEVKALSDCISQVKKIIDQRGDSDGLSVPKSSICKMQSLLLLIMSYVASILVFNKASAEDLSDQAESRCFVDAVVVFCKLQHLSPTTPIKTQVDLIVATHDLLAEYGLCCLGEGGKGEEGTFLRFAIKHLLALDMKLKSSFSHKESLQCEEVSKNSLVNVSLEESKSDTLGVQMDWTKIDEINSVKKDVSGGVISKDIFSCRIHDKDSKEVECENRGGAGTDSKLIMVENSSNQLIECGNELSEDEREELESKIDCALDQCFFCLYGLHLRSDSSYEDDLVMHKNTSRGDYQTKEQCADVFKYVLPYAKSSSRTGLVKLRRVLRAIRKHFLQPPEDLLEGNPIDRFLDDPNLCEEKLSEEAGSDGFLDSITERMFPDVGGIVQYNATLLRRSEPYLEVYCNLYYFLALSEEMSATDKWPGFVLTKEGEEFVQQNAKLFKYDLIYNPLRFESWQRLGNIYDEEVDLLLNDGSKHVNVVGWRKNATLSERVETSRRRSRRCLLMSLALAKTSAQQCEIHELLALVYYDSLQNVVPFYDQRSVLPLKDAAWMTFCENSMKHFKKAFTLKQDWLHAFYLGKLSEKLGYSNEIAISYYNKAIALNTSAVDPVYRMHASRLKLLFKHGKQNFEILKVLSANSFNQSVKESVTSILSGMETNHEELLQLDTVWSMLYNDCLSALEMCVEGDLKHFHKARYMLAQGLYKRGESGDIERAKDHLSFCFRSSRSSFTINMWEIDSMVKKGRRKTPGSAGNKKALEVNLPESSRKFITCIRKYLLFYLKLLEETGDRCILERSYAALRADKRFSLCIEDLIPVAIGRYLKALISTICHSQTAASGSVTSYDNVLERMFALFMEQGSLWPEICSLTEIEGSDMSESIIYGYLHDYIVLLEKNGKLETLEAINEKIRKRSKNPKFSDSNSAEIGRHASVAWCRSLIYNLSQITPLSCGFSNGIQAHSLTDSGMDNSQLLCIDLQPNELWSTAFQDPAHLEKIETRWSSILGKIKNIIINKASDENLETANTLLRACYNFYRESSSVVLTSGLNFYLIPSQLITHISFNPSTAGIDALDLSIPRKLLLWAYVLSHGRCASISIVVKHCEEISKSRMKRGSGTSPALSNTSPAPNLSGSGKLGPNSGGGIDFDSPHAATVASGNTTNFVNSHPSDDIQRNLFASPQLHQGTTNDAERSNLIAHEGDAEGD
ncbi:calcineurin-binding protein 1 isoform X2 [Vigna unguiculata]|uniref:Histone transcription regulator 3/CABIN1 n=1 Tax=Vigna unguiculata TaxID=3917 RepID=A0A4D6NTN5_VIGUN|nr:calcineurin-binding protein 1 isoform X2 [Vigna unguiculata]QCE16034.1 Histone transcription regulator 3/CABIN1 [Vigna unguiculata]